MGWRVAENNLDSKWDGGTVPVHTVNSFLRHSLLSPPTLEQCGALLLGVRIMIIFDARSDDDSVKANQSTTIVAACFCSVVASFVVSCRCTIIQIGYLLCFPVEILRLIIQLN
jgi:hypothetical protein